MMFIGSLFVKRKTSSEKKKKVGCVFNLKTASGPYGVY